MKKYFYSITIIAAVLLISCNKNVLNLTPQSSISPQAFFNTQNDLIIYTNSFYSYLPGTTIFTNDFNSDNIEPSGGISTLMQGNMIIPGSASSAGWNWGTLYNINFFLDHYSHTQISPALLNQYAGVAKFFRAWFYFNMMQKFGDLPWYSHAQNVDSMGLFKARDSRVLITDSIVADLDSAILYLPTTKSLSTVSQWTALALLSRVSLFEGTYRKYHTELNLQYAANDLTANNLLAISYQSAAQLMSSGTYKLYSTGNPNVDYLNLFTTAADGNSSANPPASSEFILAQVYSTSLNVMHPANGIFTTSTYSPNGLTKSLVNSYLMKNGTSFTNVSRYDTLMFAQETQNRDPRLSQTMRTPGYTRIGSSAVLLPDFTVAYTGYQPIKFVMGTNDDGNSTNSNDLPVFRYAEVLLNYAEAKAEAGVLVQSDVDMSINLLRARVGVAPLVLANIQLDTTQMALYNNTSNPAIIEIRRERRVELAMEGFRYYDVLRWKEGHLLANTFQGMYFPALGTYSLDGSGVQNFAILNTLPSPQNKSLQYFILGGIHTLSLGTNGNIIVHPTIVKTFTEPKNYLYPLPTTELVLNSNLTQNPGW